MKKTVSVILCLVMALLLVSCANASAENDVTNENNTSVTQDANHTENTTESSTLPSNEGTVDNILVAYFSCTGNTAQMADYIAQKTGGFLYDITPDMPYTNEDLDYSNASCRSNLEYKDSSSRPQIAERIKDFDKYDTIYIGYPIWYGDAPRIIYTFLESYDFSGKTIIPFCTSEQTDITKSESNIKKLAPKATWKKGKRFKPSALQSDINKWLS